MRYLLIAYRSEVQSAVLSASEKEAIAAACRPFEDRLRRSGHMVAMGNFGPPSSATVVRTRNGQLLTSDGPIAETKEPIGGFVLIEACDLNEAIRVAANHPAARLGEELGWGVEVWPFEHFEEGA